MKVKEQNVPVLRFPGFSEGWTVQEARNIFLNSRSKGNDSLPIYSVTQGKGLVPRNTLNRKMQNDAKSESNLHVIPNDLAYNMMRMWQGAVGIANQECMVSPAYIVLRPQEGISSQFFIHFFFRARSLYLFTSYSYGLTSDRLRLYYKDFSSIKFATPSLPEQQKIASSLTAVDSKIEQLSKKKALLGQYKKGMMQKIFSQELRFKDEQGNDFPDWEVKRLGEVADTTTGSSNRQDSTETGEYAFFDRSNDIRASSIFLFDCESIIVAGEGKKFIPRYFVGKFDLHQRAYATMNFKENSGKFLYFWMMYKSSVFLKYAVGSTMPSLRLPAFKNFPLNLPHPDEQKKIADFLSAIEEKKNLVTTELNHARSFKKSLLQQMFV